MESRVHIGEHGAHRLNEFLSLIARHSNGEERTDLYVFVFGVLMRESLLEGVGARFGAVSAFFENDIFRFLGEIEFFEGEIRMLEGEGFLAQF